MVIADESSKANLTTLLKLSDSNNVTAVASALAKRPLRGLRLPTGLRSTRGVTSTGDNAVPRIRSWGEIFSIGSDDPSGLELTTIPEITRELTLWGDGRMNLLRSSDEVIFAVSRAIVSDSQSRDWMEAFRESFPQRLWRQYCENLGWMYASSRNCRDCFQLTRRAFRFGFSATTGRRAIPIALPAVATADCGALETIRYAW